MSRASRAAPGIRLLGPVAAPPGRPGGRIEIPAPGGGHRLVFHSPWEKAMGAGAWKASLFGGRRDVSDQHPKLFAAAAFRAEGDLAPWRRDGGALACLDWGVPGALLYDLASKRRHPVGPQDFVLAAPWASGADRLLLVTGSGGVLLDAKGNPVARAAWKDDLGQPKAHWTPSGGQFFAIVRPSSRLGTRIAFFSAETGKPVSEGGLDPLDLLPYDAKAYAKLGRQRGSLVLGDAGSGAGVLLDVWSDWRYEAAAGRLLLCGHRPVSKPHRDPEGALVCRAEPRWVELRVEVV